MRKTDVRQGKLPTACRAIEATPDYRNRIKVTKVTVQLRELLEGIAISHISGDLSMDIAGLAYDSRKVKPGFLFVALRGHQLDGRHFIRDAISNGAVAVIQEEVDKEVTGEEPRQKSGTEITRIQVEDARETLSELAVRFYDYPFSGIPLIGITGTNGKTTTSYLLESILITAGKRPGTIGTINYRSPDKTWEAPVTTPESLDLMRIIRDMASEKVTHIVMEVSSHALHQGRVRNCPFQTAIFTNLSRDHLDYHESMDAYFAIKSLLFKGLSKSPENDSATAVINWDDPRGKELANLTGVPVLTYGLGKGCQVRAEDIHASDRGLTANLITPSGDVRIQSRLIGDFNLYNILAAAAGALSVGIELGHISSGIADLHGVPGRLERVENEHSLSIVVDYAHTPDALSKALDALRKLTAARLITVFGCGGNRDRGKRSEMGLVAGKKSDMVFITSDNPRDEDPLTIAQQVEEGVKKSGLGSYFLDLDRKSAIQKAIQAANQDDMILIAGKGHESYQVIAGTKRHFDDREAASEAASLLS